MSTIAFWPLDVYGLKAAYLEHAPTKVSWACLLDPAVYHKSRLPVQLHTLLRSWNAEFLLLIDQPTDPSFLSKCLSVIFSFPYATIRSGAMLEISLIINWRVASLLIKLLIPYPLLPRSSASYCYTLRLTTKITALYLFLRSVVNWGHGSKTKEHIRYNTISYLQGHLNWHAAGLRRTAFVKGEPSWLCRRSSGLYFNFINNHKSKQLNPGDIF